MGRTRLLGLLGAAVAAVMTLVWTLVVPEQAERADGTRELALRLGHPMAWAALSVLGLAVALDARPGVRTAAGTVAATCYAAFVLALVL